MSPFRSNRAPHATSLTEVMLTTYGDTFSSQPAASVATQGDEQDIVPTESLFLAQLEERCTTVEAFPDLRRRSVAELFDAARSSQQRCHGQSILGVRSSAFDISVDQVIQDALARHAYVATATIAIVTRIRAETLGTPFCPDQIVATKADLAFWRMLKGAGRKAHPIEIIGAFIHWNAEVAQGRALPTPDFSLVLPTQQGARPA